MVGLIIIFAVWLLLAFLVVRAHRVQGKALRTERSSAHDQLDHTRRARSRFDDDEFTHRINPSTGLPMMGGSHIDISGTPYGMSSSHAFDDAFDWNGASAFSESHFSGGHDHFGGHDSFSSHDHFGDQSGGSFGGGLP